jgi:uncharacterized protein YfaS (alpha-2-macroglobulin family)
MRASHIQKSLLYVALLFTSFVLAQAQDAKPSGPSAATLLVGMTPEGDDVEPPSQIVFQFSRPVVPLGRMERGGQEIAISITPKLACEWRWINTSSLSCNLGQKTLPQVATTYRVEIPKTFDLSRGEVLSEAQSRTFTTRRPRVTESWFKTWNAPGLPSIAIATNQQVSADALTETLLLEDAQKVSYEFTVAEMTPAPEDELSEDEIAEQRGQRWIITPKKELPLDSAIALNIQPGLRPHVGSERGIENRTIVKFSTFPEFSFLGVSCMDIKGNPILLPVAGQVSSKNRHRCDPLNSVRLLFSSPVLKEGVKDGLTSKPDLRGGSNDFDPWENVYSFSRLQDAHRRGEQYGVSLPFGLKADTEYSFLAPADRIRDQFGRPLSKPLETKFFTDHRPPRYVLDNQVSVLEKQTDSQLPVIVNNISSLNLTYQTLTSAGTRSGITKTITPYKAQDIAYSFPIDVRAMLGGSSGVVQGTLASQPSTSEGTKWFFSQVTPYAVHVKLGHFSSAVWVTSLATGEPIPSAKVSIITDTLTNLSATPKVLASSATDAAGVASLSGTDAIDPDLALLSQWETNKPKLMVRVEKDGDLALVPIGWDFQVYAGDVYPQMNNRYGHVHAWGTTAQGLYKAGDTVQFTLWVRNQNNDTFVPAPREGYKLEVMDPTGKVVFEVPSITLSEFGSFAGSFTTKADAAVGWYTFGLSSNFSKARWEPIKVLLSDFSPASFKVQTEILGGVLRSESEVNVTTQARLHAGGPYSDAAARVTAIVRGTPLEASVPQLERFYFESQVGTEKEVHQAEAKLDAGGDLTTKFPMPKTDIPYGDLVVESAVRDDRGKSVANIAKARFVGRDRYVGVAHSGWLLTSGQESTALGAVIDGEGKQLVGAPFSISIEREETKAVRVKSAGNAYVTKYENTWIAVKQCDLVSRAEPSACVFTPPLPGEYRITGIVRDIKGVEHRSSISRWATGKGDVVWESGTNTELSIVPEKKSYKVGETAKFLIQNPYPGARALLTVERYGIQRSWTQVLPDSSAVIEFPVTKDQTPGFFFSATVVSPRVDKPIEGVVDLGKPAFKLGYSQIAVVDPAQQLQIDVKPRAASYRPRESVTVDIAGRSSSGVSAPMEYAVTVLDEGVFDLIRQGRGYFDPYQGFYSLDGLDVQNYNIIKMLIGRQKFEKKGANAGGDGGSQLDMRTIKKYVSYWNPSIRPDANGKATITFDAPDNLTGWKVLVMAVTKEDQMGLGTGSFTVNKQTEVRSALPNQVRAGDTFAATFTVMNRTDSTRALSIEARSEGDAVQGALSPMQLVAEPFKRYPIVIAATAVRSGEARFVVRASDQIDGDGVVATIPVLERAALQIAANFGSSDGSEVREPIAFPADLQPSVGSVGVVLSPSVIGGLEGAFAYMREYPYGCWEQKISKAVMAAHSVTLAGHLPTSFRWKGAQDLVRETLTTLSSFQAPNGGMSFYKPQDEHVSPYLSAYTALALTWLRDGGYTIPERDEAKLQEYLSTLLRNDAFPTFFSPGMKSSVRAVALAALARRGKATSADLMRYRSVVRQMNLFGKAHFLEAALRLNANSAVIDEVVTQILSFGNESAGTYALTEPVEAVSQRILDSNMRSRCAVLSSFLGVAEGKGAASKRLQTIVPKIVRSITLERARKDRWENTQENLFCVHALAEYSRRFEATSPNLTLDVRLGSESLSTVALKSTLSEPLEVSRPLKASDAGHTENLIVAPQGRGRFYYTGRLTYSPKDLKTSPTNSGMELAREYSVLRDGQWTILKEPVTLKQGELVKIDLFLHLAAPRNFVVVNDPIPGGLEAVNRELGTASTVDAAQGDFVGSQSSIWFDRREWTDYGATFWSFYHRELRDSAARFYAEYLPAGNYHLSYVSQAIAAGSFVILPAHAEEMYDPDVYGDSAADTLRVEALQ